LARAFSITFQFLPIFFFGSKTPKEPSHSN
jgi:hypothetical protein